MTSLANHLWQSTLVLLAIFVLTRGLRHNRAAVRHGLWLIASLKFLFPFDALVAVGRQFGRAAPAVAATPVAQAFQLASEPFSHETVAAIVTAAATVTPAPAPEMFPLWTMIPLIWGAGVLVSLSCWAAAWLHASRVSRRTDAESDAVVSSAVARIAALTGTRPIGVAVCDTRIEPGIFGIWRPVLIWPRALTAQLSEREIETVVAHELCHVARHDNLTGAIHRLTAALFWFHPGLVWAGAQMRIERERACDERVLAAGFVPRIYAESIVKTCEFCVPSRAVAMTGATGSLPTRVVGILRGQTGGSMRYGQRLTLGSAAVAAIICPLAIGAVSAPDVRAQASVAAAGPISTAAPSIEVASVRRNTGQDGRVLITTEPGGHLRAVNVPLGDLIRFGYQMHPSQIVGGPAWITEDRFDVVVKADTGFQPPASELARAPSAPQLLIRRLLADRFKLITHSELREMSTYDLVLLRRDGTMGKRLKPSAVDCTALAAVRRADGPAPPPDRNGLMPCAMRVGPGVLNGSGIAISFLAESLSQVVQRVVVDKTGLSGSYEFALAFAPDGPPAGLTLPPGVPVPPPVDSNAPSVYAALQEQLGLKLEGSRGQLPVLVIDRIERPAPD